MDDAGCFLMSVRTFTLGRDTDPSIRASSTAFVATLSLKVPRPRDGGSPSTSLGTFDFATAAFLPFGRDADPPVRVSVLDNGNRAYFAAEGTVRFDELTQPLSDEMRGRLDAVRLFELSTARVADAGVNAPAAFERADGGRCVSLVSTAFNTVGGMGASCVDAVDCGDPTIRACDPNLGQCINRTCSLTGDAGPGLVCGSQRGGGAAVYTRCNPLTGDPCRADQTCSKSQGTTEGVCVFAGSLTRFEACPAPTDTTDPCGAGVQCAFVTSSMRACTIACDAWSSSGPACAIGERCTGQVCGQPTLLLDPSTLGQRCVLGNTSKLCADDGSKYAGVCHTLVDAGFNAGFRGRADGIVIERECRRSCLLNTHCGDGGSCAFGGCYP